MNELTLNDSRPTGLSPDRGATVAPDETPMFWAAPRLPSLAERVMLLAIAQEAGFLVTASLDELDEQTHAIGIGVTVWSVGSNHDQPRCQAAAGHQVHGNSLPSCPLLGSSLAEAWCLTVGEALATAPWTGVFAPSRPDTHALAVRAARWRDWLAEQRQTCPRRDGDDHRQGVPAVTAAEQA